MRREISEDELRFFYQKTGEAIWHLQYVEDFLSKLYFVKEIASGPSSITEPVAKEEMAKLSRKTLGQLIGMVEKASLVPNSLIAKLKSFNDTRKWVVHNSSRESGHDLYTDAGRAEVFGRILEFTNNAIALQKEIESDLLDHHVSHGLSVEQVYDDAENTIRKLKGQE